MTLPRAISSIAKSTVTNCPEDACSQEELVGPGEDGGRRGVERGQSPEGGSHRLGQRGRLYSAPADVAYHDGDPLVLEDEEVVEIPAYPLGRVSRPVGQTDLESGNSCDRFEQARLEHLGDPVLVGVQLGILEGQGKSRGDLLDEVQLRLAECTLAAVTAEAERTDHPIPRPEWHMHHLRARLSRGNARSSCPARRCSRPPAARWPGPRTAWPLPWGRPRLGSPTAHPRRIL